MTFGLYFQLDERRAALDEVVHPEVCPLASNIEIHEKATSLVDKSLAKKRDTQQLFAPKPNAIGLQFYLPETNGSTDSVTHWR
jgi:hypothetical protein